MLNLTIKVLGSGMIPRGLGLAPRLTPFVANEMAIDAIIKTKGLSIEYKNAKGKFEPLTMKVFKNLTSQASTISHTAHRMPQNNINPVKHDAPNNVSNVAINPANADEITINPKYQHSQPDQNNDKHDNATEKVEEKVNSADESNQTDDNNTNNNYNNKKNKKK